VAELGIDICAICSRVMADMQNSGRGQTAGRNDAANDKSMRRDFVIAFVFAVIAAIGVERLSKFREVHGVIFNDTLWTVALLLFFFGILLPFIPWRIRGFNTLWVAPLMFGASTIFFILSVSNAPIPPAPPPPFTVMNYSSIDWNSLIENANSEVFAEGAVLDPFQVHTVVRSLIKHNGLNAKLLLLDPEGKTVLQRSTDENPYAPHDNPARIREKIKAFQAARAEPNSKDWKDRFQLLVCDNYPTMAVLVIDNDLYAYFYSFRELGTDSPVLKFSNYKQAGPLADFFNGHLRRSADPNNGAHEPQKNYMAATTTKTAKKTTKKKKK
jgi:hypothetical protein